MKLLRGSREPGVIERIRSALEGAGVDCIIRNELTSGLAPEIPLTESTPEVWVVNERQLPEAQEILAALEREPSLTGPSWSCPGCGERVEVQFDSCWRCGAHRA